MAFDTTHSTFAETAGAVLVKLRPALHRYAARRVGSALDGEDVVQEAIARAVAALDRTPPDGAVAPWLFRITHNAAVDFLRGRKRHAPARDVADGALVSGADEAARRMATRVALAVFMRLPPSPRAAGRAAAAARAPARRRGAGRPGARGRGAGGGRRRSAPRGAARTGAAM